MNPIAPGLQVGRYVIRSKIGAGGMAEVYLADDTQLGRRVALKFLPPETEADTIAQRRLLREARAAATLDHPHICSGSRSATPTAAPSSPCSTSTARRSTSACVDRRSTCTRC